jgi:Tol biopolymer transport system component
VERLHSSQKGDAMKGGRFVLGVAAGAFLVSGLAAMAQGPATVRQITEGTLDCVMGDWSPDGKWIVYMKEGENWGSFEIWKINLAGTIDTQLTDGTYECDSKPRWGAKNLIAFQRSENTEDDNIGNDVASIWVMDANGRNQKRVAKYIDSDPDDNGLVDDGGAQWPTWNPAGTRIAYKFGTSEANKQLWVVNSTGLGKQNVSGLGMGPHQMISWKPAGLYANMAIVASFQKQWGDYRGLARVAVNDVLPSKWITDPNDMHCQMMPSYSPDGTKVAYKDDTEGRGNIWIMTDGGRNKVRLTDNSSDDMCHSNPQWLGNKYIAFWGSDDGVVRVWVMTADGTHAAPVTDHIDRGWTLFETMLRPNKAGTKILINSRDEGGNYQVTVVELDTADSDGDGLLNWQEAVWGCDPSDRDSNDDGIGDGASVARGIDPGPADEG